MPPRFLNAYNDWYVGGVLQAHMNTRPRAEGYPRTWVKRVAAGRSIPDADDPETEILAGRRGEHRYPRTTRGKSLTFEFQQQAESEIEATDSIAALQAAFTDVSSIGVFVVTPWPGHASDIWACFAQIDDFDCDEQLVYQPGEHPPWKADGTLVVRMLDGRWLHFNESGAWPDAPATAMLFEANPGGGVIVTNSGLAPVEPKITVFGVNAGEDLHTGRDLAGGGSVSVWLRDPVGLAGIAGPADVVIDSSQLPPQITVGFADVSASYDAAASDWWDEGVEGVPPGAHNIWIGPGAGTGIRVEFFSGNW